MKIVLKLRLCIAIIIAVSFFSSCSVSYSDNLSKDQIIYLVKNDQELIMNVLKEIESTPDIVLISTTHKREIPDAEFSSIKGLYISIIQNEDYIYQESDNGFLKEIMNLNGIR